MLRERDVHTRDEYSEMDGMVLKGEKFVIPTLLIEEMLKHINSGHMGIEKSKQCTRDILFWPGMSKQITQCNGTSEKAVQIAKSLMDKAKADKKRSLCQNTPVDGFRSPAHEQKTVIHSPHYQPRIHLPSKFASLHMYFLSHYAYSSIYSSTNRDRAKTSCCASHRFI